MPKIHVTYNGKFPNVCKGVLTVYVDDIIIYINTDCCTSTGCVYFDDDWNEHVISGELIWNDRNKYDEDIQLAVQKVLSKVNVCCGGCV